MVTSGFLEYLRTGDMLTRVVLLSDIHLDYPAAREHHQVQLRVWDTVGINGHYVKVKYVLPLSVFGMHT